MGRKKHDKLRKFFIESDSICLTFGCRGKLNFRKRSVLRDGMGYYFDCEVCSSKHRVVTPFEVAENIQKLLANDGVTWEVEVNE